MSSLVNVIGEHKHTRAGSVWSLFVLLIHWSSGCAVRELVNREHEEENAPQRH